MAKKHSGALVAQQKRHRELIAQNNMLSDKLRALRGKVRDLMIRYTNQRGLMRDLLKENSIEVPDWLTVEEEFKANKRA